MILHLYKNARRCLHAAHLPTRLIERCTPLSQLSRSEFVYLEAMSTGSPKHQDLGQFQDDNIFKKTLKPPSN